MTGSVKLQGLLLERHDDPSKLGVAGIMLLLVGVKTKTLLVLLLDATT